MLNLAIDIGNTCAKLAAYAGPAMASEVVVCPHEALLTEALGLCSQYGARRAAVASVSVDGALVAEQLRAEGIEACHITAATELPFAVDYATPSTLGVDRIAAVAGAVAEFGQRNMLIVDAGTAITFELFTADGVYRGGCISPGITMRCKALNAFTARLPLVSAADYDEWIGRSTAAALAAGVINGVVFEIDGYIDRLKSQYHNFDTVVITGGDYKYFAQKLKNSIFVRPNLVLDGINFLSEKR